MESIKDEIIKNPALDAIVRAIADRGGRTLLVGGSVRDRLMGNVGPSKDYDIEVHGIPIDELLRLIANHADRVPMEVGVSFGVIKARADGLDLDFNLPRRETKKGPGHRGFDVEPDHTMDSVDAASRRDFTMNSMAVDLVTGEIIDPFNGLHDIQCKVLKHTSSAFAEDPLRVLRAMQFAARFDMAMAEETRILCENLYHEYVHLAVERVWMEWDKWAMRGIVPSRGLRILLSTTWIDRYPELAALVDCKQDIRWHPEGSVWDHSLLAVDAAARIAVRENLDADDRLSLIFGALCHDMGKPMTTVVEFDGCIISEGHAEAGVEITRSFLARIGFPERLMPRVTSLVAEHMAHVSFMIGYPSDRAVRRLAMRLMDAGNTIQMLGHVVEADHGGRSPLPGGMPLSMARVLEVASDLNVKERGPAPILMGRHLLELGIKPGPPMGLILKAAMRAQLDGEFENLEEAIAWHQARGAADEEGE